MTRDEAVQKLSKVARISMSYAEDLYDSLFPEPVVKQYVADWYEENKDDFKVNIWARLIDWDRRKNHPLFNEWFDQTDNPIQTLVNMHQFGYEVEKEARYRVKIKGTGQYLTNDGNWPHFNLNFKSDLTKAEIELLGLGWVFSCEGIEIEEVE